MASGSASMEWDTATARSSLIRVYSVGWSDVPDHYQKLMGYVIWELFSVEWGIIDPYIDQESNTTSSRLTRRMQSRNSMKESVRRHVDVSLIQNTLVVFFSGLEYRY